MVLWVWVNGQHNCEFPLNLIYFNSYSIGPILRTMPCHAMPCKTFFLFQVQIRVRKWFDIHSRSNAHRNLSCCFVIILHSHPSFPQLQLYQSFSHIQSLPIWETESEPHSPFLGWESTETEKVQMRVAGCISGPIFGHFSKKKSIWNRIWSISHCGTLCFSGFVGSNFPLHGSYQHAVTTCL